MEIMLLWDIFDVIVLLNLFKFCWKLKYSLGDIEAVFILLPYQ